MIETGKVFEDLHLESKDQDLPVESPVQDLPVESSDQDLPVESPVQVSSFGAQFKPKV